jgi:hypothetical protein
MCGHVVEPRSLTLSRTCGYLQVREADAVHGLFRPLMTYLTTQATRAAALVRSLDISRRYLDFDVHYSRAEIPL